MNSERLLSDLRARQVRVEARDGRLVLDAPKGALSENFLAEIRAHRDELIALVVAASHGPETIARQPRRSDPACFPLSLAQHAFYMLDHMDPDGQAYNLFAVRRVAMTVSAGTLQQALFELVRRHEPLRTSFAYADGASQQRVHRHIAARLHVVDLSGLAPEAKADALAATIDRRRLPRFDLAQAPLFCAELIRLAPDEHVFTLAMHHIVADAVTLDVLLADLMANYVALERGRPLALPEPAMQYVDYAAWQASRLEAGELTRDVDFWTAELAELPTLLAPLRANAGMLSTRCRSMHAKLDVALTAKLRRLARQAKVSTFAVLLAGFQVLLSRHLRVDDIPVITPVSGRRHPGTERLVGLFLTGVVVRTRLDPAATVADLLRSVQSGIARALEHQDVSLEVLEGQLRRREVLRIDLADMSTVAFNHIVAAAPEADSASEAGPELDVIEVDRTHTAFDMMMLATERRDVIDLKLECKQDLVDAALATRLIDHFVALLRALPDGLTGRLDALDFIPPDQWPALLGRDPASGERMYRVDRRRGDVLGPQCDAEQTEARVICVAHPLPAAVDDASLGDAIDALVRRTSALRTRFLHAPPPLQPGLIACVAETVSAWTDPSADAPKFDPLQRIDTPNEAALRQTLDRMAQDVAPACAAPPWRLAVARVGGEPPRLLLLANAVLLDEVAGAALLSNLWPEDRPEASPVHADAVPPPAADGSETEVGALSIDAFEPLLRDDVVAALSATARPDAPARTVRIEGRARERLRVVCDRLAVSEPYLLEMLFGLLAGVAGGAAGAYVVRVDRIHAIGPGAACYLAVPAAASDPDLPLLDLPGLLQEIPMATARRLQRTGRWPNNRPEFTVQSIVWPAAASAAASAAGLEPVFPGRPAPGHQHCQFEVQSDAIVLRMLGAEGLELALPDRLADLVEQIADGAETVGQLRFASPSETVMTPERDDPRSAITVTELVRRQAARTPDAIAVRFSDRVLSFAELDRASDALAARLHARCSTGGVVAVALARSELLVVALLATLKAGLVYLPLDPETTPARRTEMIERAGATVILCEDHDAADPPPAAATAIPLCELWPDGGPDEIDCPPAPAATAPAYVMFTSGSTGRPKGVQVSQGALGNVLCQLAGPLGIGPGDTLLAVTTVGFDISLLELLLPLSAGATVAVALAADQRSGARLAALLERHQATVMQATPVTWRMLIDAGWTAPRRFTALCGGETLPPDLAAALLARTSALWNLYGPTEATIWATAERVRRVDGPIPIGRPLAGAVVLLLDAAGHEVPPGMPGEICIAGPGLAEGYIGDPAETAARFVFWRRPAGPELRIYCTGDRGARGPDGTLHYLGRRDRQVKIRGHRIELGEVEAHLARLLGVREAAVAFAGRDGDARLVAAIVPTDGAVTAAALRSALREQLPQAMVPGEIALVDALPRKANGKIDGTAIADLRETAAATVEPPRNSHERAIAEIWAEVLGKRGFGVRDNFFDVGGHSLLILEVHHKLTARLDAEVSVVDLFQHTTIEKLAAFLDPRTAPTDSVAPAGPASLRQAEPPKSRDVAIIGMAGRFPGAADVERFWENLAAGVESIRPLAEQELVAAGIQRELLDNPRYVRAASPLDGVDLFDAGLFAMARREAELLDPQHRVLLECAHSALQDAAYDPESYPGRIGAFVGVGFSSYLVNHILARSEALAGLAPLEVTFANEKDYAATRLAYKLNLRGPAVLVGTACSTALVALHQACASLLDGECDMALAGASRAMVPQIQGYLHVDGGILSPDGHCRAFDARAGGTVFGNGAGVVVLKRLDLALRDGDAVHAVIKATAVNNDGNAKAGFTAPCVEGQAAVIAEAQRRAGVSPGSIGYVEAHGTGTRLGDPIEVAALRRAFDDSGGGARCALGSVKTNIGHLDTAAGIAGLIKTVLCLKHGQIPASLHFETANSALELERSPFYVSRELHDWPDLAGPRRAGVSSFGIGGTNAHVVLEQAPEPVEPRTGRADAPPQLIALSAQSLAALAETSERLAVHLAGTPSSRFANTAYSLQVGRRALTHRRAEVAGDGGEAAAALTREDTGPPVAVQGTRPRLALLFPGQGAPLAPARALYRADRELRARIDEILSLAGDAGTVARPIFAGQDGDAAALWRRTLHAQLALFAFEYALAERTMSWGLRPDGLLGHSLGEYVAASLAGVFRLPQAIRLVVERARLMEATAEGEMAVAIADADALRPLLTDGCWIAAENASEVTILSGEPAALERTLERAAAEGVHCHRLPVTRAFHSPLMEPAAAELTAAAARAEPATPELPIVSNVSGDWMTAEDAVDPGYWGRQLTARVRFAKGLRTLAAQAPVTLLEIGPGTHLTALAREVASGDGCFAVACLPDTDETHAGDARRAPLRALGRLWRRGHAVDWPALHGAADRRRMHLPVGAFDRQRYWLGGGAGLGADAAPMGRMPQDAWIHAPAWNRRKLAPAAADAEPDAYLILAADFAVDGGISRELSAHLSALGHPVAVICKRGSEALEAAGAIPIDADEPADYRAVIQGIVEGGLRPTRVVHLWAARAAPARDPTSMPPEVTSCDAFGSLIHLAQAMARAGLSGPLQLAVVVTLVHAVTGYERLDPTAALAHGPTRVLPREFHELRCALIDAEPAPSATARRRLAARIVDEFAAGLPASLVAYRGDHRWVRNLAQCDATAVAPAPKLRPTYLITGGLGGIGCVLAAHLAHTRSARLALVGRSRLDETEHAPDSPHGRFQALRAQGVEANYYVGDVIDAAGMRRIVTEIERDGGAIDGVVHAAGLSSGHLSALASRAELDAVLAPKVDGGRVLIELFDGKPLEFLVFCSSITAVTGEVGQIANCAANAYLDALAEAARNRGLPAIAIGWDVWRESGMAVAEDLPAALVQQRRREIALGLSDAEGCAVFERILASGLVHAVVSTRDLTTRLAPSPPASTSPCPASAEATGDRAGTGGGQPAGDGAYTPTQRALADLWQASFGVPLIGVDEDFFELGGTSLQALQLAASIETRLGARVHPEQLLHLRTVRALAAVIDDGRGPDNAYDVADNLIVLRQGESATPALFLVHPVGGQVFVYRELAQRLRVDGPVVAIKASLDGAGGGTTVEALAESYLAAVRRAQPHGPYRLGGASFGGMVAFEMARQLEARGQRVDLVAMLDTPGGDQIVQPFTKDAEVLTYLAAHLPPEAGLNREALDAVAEEWRLAYFLDRVEAAGGLNEPLNTETLRGYLDVFKANMQAMRAFQPRRIGSAVLFLKAVVRRPVYDPPDPERSWQRLCRRFDLVEVPGNHMSMLFPPHCEVLAERLGAALR